LGGDRRSTQKKEKKLGKKKGGMPGGKGKVGSSSRPISVYGESAVDPPMICGKDHESRGGLI